MPSPATLPPSRRSEILRSPYAHFLQGRRWTPQRTSRFDPLEPTAWTSVLVPPPLTTIESETEYLFLLARRLEWLIDQAIADWSQTYPSPPQAHRAIAQELNYRLPSTWAISVGSDFSPQTWAIAIIQEYPEVRAACFRQAEPHFPLPIPAQPQGLAPMSLWEWLEWFESDLNPQ